MSELSHPHTAYEWGCPDCGSTDISQTGKNTTTAVRPPHLCYDCGIRFWEPVEIEVGA